MRSSWVTPHGRGRKSRSNPLERVTTPSAGGGSLTRSNPLEEPMTSLAGARYSYVNMAVSNPQNENEENSESADQYEAETEVRIPPSVLKKAITEYKAAKSEKGKENVRFDDYLHSQVTMEFDWKLVEEEDAEDAPESVDRPNGKWEESGREMLEWLHAQVRDDLVTAIDTPAFKVDRGEQITEVDAEYLREAIGQAEFLLEQVETVADDDC